MELYHAFKELESGVREHILSRSALATRNLLELRYWTLFAAVSEENIWRIRKDALIDARDMLDRFSAACQVNAELAPALTDIQQAQTRFEDQCNQSGESAEGCRHRLGWSNYTFAFYDSAVAQPFEFLRGTESGTTLHFGILRPHLPETYIAT